MNEHYNHNDHQDIFLDIRNANCDNRVSNRNGKTRIVGWPTGAFKEGTFLAVLEGDHDPKGCTGKSESAILESN